MDGGGVNHGAAMNKVLIRAVMRTRGEIRL
jgi:hypothetical protein